MIVGALNSLISGGRSLSFEDYLAQVLALGDALAPELLTLLRTLATQIRHIVAPWQDATFPTWPEPATPAAMLGWLQRVNAPAVSRNRATPVAGGIPSGTDQRTAPEPAGRDFPGPGTTHEQLQWLLTDP
ncbi:hypothetical protein CWS02_14030 [Enterobacter sp. EA-1]|nr:hypothetical protein CWS02_14030 [Enterobacter sp. EA-1]